MQCLVDMPPQEKFGARGQFYYRRSISVLPSRLMSWKFQSGLLDTVGSRRDDSIVQHSMRFCSKLGLGGGNQREDGIITHLPLPPDSSGAIEFSRWGVSLFLYSNCLDENGESSLPELYQCWSYYKSARWPISPIMIYVNGMQKALLILYHLLFDYKVFQLGRLWCSVPSIQLCNKMVSSRHCREILQACSGSNQWSS